MSETAQSMKKSRNRLRILVRSPCSCEAALSISGLKGNRNGIVMRRVGPAQNSAQTFTSAASPVTLTARAMRRQPKRRRKPKQHSKVADMPPMIGERSPAPAAFVGPSKDGTVELARERRTWSLDSLTSKPD